MALALYVNWFSKTLVASPTRGGLFVLPSFTEGDVIPMTVRLIQPDPDGGVRYITPDISNVALSLTVEDTTGTPIIVSAPTWSKDVALGEFSALVAFNAAALGTWIGASLTKTATLKIKKTDADGSIVTVYTATITILADVSAATPSGPLIGTTPLTLEAASQMFAKKMMDAGDTITFRTQDGTVGRTIGIKKETGGEIVDIDYQYNI